jgi:hypothetical protein
MNNTLAISESADKPPTRNETKRREKPIAIGVNF